MGAVHKGKNEDDAIENGNNYIEDRIDHIEKVVGTGIRDLEYVEEAEIDKGE